MTNSNLKLNGMEKKLRGNSLLDNFLVVERKTETSRREQRMYMNFHLRVLARNSVLLLGVPSSK